MNIRNAITTAMQHAAHCAPVAALHTCRKPLNRFTPPRSVNPTTAHGNGGVPPEVHRMKRRTSPNTRTPRNVAVLLALLAIAFTCCWSPTASAQVIADVPIPDEILRSKLLEALGREGDSDPRISSIEMQSVQDQYDTLLLSAASTTLPEDRITDLTGLEYATNVLHLHLNYHAISDLSPIADLRELQTLNLVDNNISDLSPIALRPTENPARRRGLTSLSVAGNNIRDVSNLDGLPALTTLRLSRNPIGDNIGGLQSLTVLRNLYMDNIGLRDLQPIAGLTTLQILSAEGNQITDISPLSNLTDLTNLFLNENQIRDISSLKDLENLQKVGLEGNEIRDISPIAGWTHLSSGWPLEIRFFSRTTTGLSTNPLSYPSIYTHSVELLNGNRNEFNGLYHAYHPLNGRFFRNVYLYLAAGRLRAPTTLEIVSEAEQNIPYGGSVAPLVVKVLDQYGEPFAAVPVEFAVTAGDGTVGTAETATHDPTYDLRDDEEGKAMTTFTVAPALGEQTVVATVTHKVPEAARDFAFDIEDTAAPLAEAVTLEDITLEATFTINVLPYALDVLHSAPDASTVAPADPTALQVNWQAPAYAIQNYEVRYRVEDSEAWTTAAYKGTEPSTTLTDLIPGTTYEWQVRAQTSVGPSPWSLSQRGTTGYVLLQTRELSPSPVASDRLVFNELRNVDDDTHDWLELKNISDADIALSDWEISIVAQPGGGTPQDKAIADFPDATLPAGEVLLIVNTDPRQTDLAGGVDIKTGLGKRGARHRYFVAADLKLPSSPYLLLLRSATDKNGTPDAVEDIAGNYFRETGDLSYGDAGTQVWPLQDTARPLPADAALLTAGEAWARVSTETRGYLAAAWGKSGHQAGLGYQQNVVASETSLGTPGYANAAIVVEAPSGRVSISEIMLATKAGRRTVPQWIELYNNSTTEAVKLEGWRLEIEYLKGEDARRHRFDEVSLTPLTVLPNQTVLLATWRAETSGHFPEGKVYNLYFEHPNAFNQRERRNDVLNAAGFSVRLSDASGTLVDSVGNLDGVARTKDTPMWEVPSGTTAEGARASLIRQYEDSAPLPGTDAAGWKSAANVKLAVSTYYGWETDIGTPGYREGGPLPVVLSHFQSVRTDTGVVIRWTTESSVDNAGFNILRSENLSGPFTKINPALIAGSGTTGESSAYLFTDSSAKPGVVYYYRLEEVSLRGVHQSLATTRVRGHVSASGKRITRWSELKSSSSR